MIAAQRILCPIDLSECSRRALQFTAALARSSGASIVVLQVGQNVYLYPALVVQVDPVVVPQPTREERARDVAGVIAPFSDLPRPIDVLLKEGDVVRTIIKAAADERADLIVMGTHGHRGFRRLVIGSIAKHVVHTAACPVLVVPPGPAPQPTLRGFERIVCRGAPVDLAYARAFAADPASHVEAIPAGERVAEVLDCVTAARADLIVWSRVSALVDDIVAKAIAPVLVAHDAVPKSWAASSSMPPTLTPA